MVTHVRPRRGGRGGCGRGDLGNIKTSQGWRLSRLSLLFWIRKLVTRTHAPWRVRARVAAKHSPNNTVAVQAACGAADTAVDGRPSGVLVHTCGAAAGGPAERGGGALRGRRSRRWRSWPRPSPRTSGRRTGPGRGGPPALHARTHARTGAASQMPHSDTAQQPRQHSDTAQLPRQQTRAREIGAMVPWC